MTQTFLNTAVTPQEKKQAQKAAFFLEISRSELVRRAVREFVDRLDLPNFPTLSDAQDRQGGAR